MSGVVRRATRLGLDPTIDVHGAVASATSEGQHKEEPAAWREVSGLVPHDDRVLSNLASAEMNAGNLDEALKLFDQVLTHNPPPLLVLSPIVLVCGFALGANVRDLFPDLLRAVKLSE